jgi:hypothetical protein
MKKITGEQKPIPGFSDYVVTSKAEVWNIKKMSQLTASPSSNGYLYITLFKNNKQHKFGLQVLVATAFVPGKTKVRNRVRFKNHDKTDCRPKNLEWCTHQEACKKGLTGHHKQQSGESNHNSKLSVEDVKTIRKTYEKAIQDHNPISTRQLGEQYGVSGATIQKIITNQTWKNV